MTATARVERARSPHQRAATGEVPTDFAHEGQQHRLGILVPVPFSVRDKRPSGVPDHLEVGHASILSDIGRLVLAESRRVRAVPGGSAGLRWRFEPGRRVGAGGSSRVGACCPLLHRTKGQDAPGRRRGEGKMRRLAGEGVWWGCSTSCILTSRQIAETKSFRPLREVRRCWASRRPMCSRG